MTVGSCMLARGSHSKNIPYPTNQSQGHMFICQKAASGVYVYLTKSNGNIILIYWGVDRTDLGSFWIPSGNLT